MEAREVALPRLLEPLEREIAQAHARVVQGLEAKPSSRSLAAFHRADREYEAVLHRLDRIERRHPSDRPLTDAATALRDRARAGEIQTAIDAGHVYLARADYQDALREADRAVAIDPKDAGALGFRESASLPVASVIGVLPLRMHRLIASPGFELRTLPGAARSIR